MAAHQSLKSPSEGMLSLSCKGENQGSRDYWNIEDILAEEERCPVTFLEDAKGLGYLDNIDQVNPDSLQS